MSGHSCGFGCQASLGQLNDSISYKPPGKGNVSPYPGTHLGTLFGNRKPPQLRSRRANRNRRRRRTTGHGSAGLPAGGNCSADSCGDRYHRLPSGSPRLSRPPRPDCVINCAAYNFVDRAEDEPGRRLRRQRRRPATTWPAGAGTVANAILVHVSTDYVFGFEYRPHSCPIPRLRCPDHKASMRRANWRVSQIFVRADLKRHFIVRTCGPLQPSLERRAKETSSRRCSAWPKSRPELSIVDDQHCTPSYAVDVAAAIARLIETEHYGLYHATNFGDTTWYQFTRQIFHLAKIDIKVRPVSSSEYPQKAKRPGYSVLDCEKLTGRLGGPRPTWQDLPSLATLPRSVRRIECPPHERAS